MPIIIHGERWRQPSSVDVQGIFKGVAVFSHAQYIRDMGLGGA